MDVPEPGKAARGTTSGRPIMVALDVLGRRGALRIIWELRERGTLTFRALQDACEANPGLLNTRLKELRHLQLVEHVPGGYRLTDHGRALSTALKPLNAWASTWAEDVGSKG
jgi:DNA-binding HxlR family transcriptional regulator